ncbi:unnamed protein product, partial [Polarella glacialis]
MRRLQVATAQLASLSASTSSRATLSGTRAPFAPAGSAPRDRDQAPALQGSVLPPRGTEQRGGTEQTHNNNNRLLAGTLSAALTALRRHQRPAAVGQAQRRAAASEAGGGGSSSSSSDARGQLLSPRQ